MPKSQLDEAIKFCQEARNILGTPGYAYGTYSTEESKAAKKALDAVASKLKAFKERGSGDYINCVSDFNYLADLGKRAKASNDRSLALTLTARLVDLSNRLDAAANKNVDLAVSRSTLTTAVEKIYEDDLKAAGDRKKELNDKNTQPPAHTLYGGPFTFDGGVGNLIDEAERTAVTPNTATATANLPKRAESVTEAIKILAGVKTAHSEGLKLHTDYEAYKAKMDQAEKYRVELFLLSTVKVDYSETFTTQMAAARDAALAAVPNGSPHDFQTAVTELTNVISTYKTLKKEADAAEGKEKLDAEKKPSYDDKVRRIQNDIRELEALPGTQSAVKTLKQKLEASEIAAGKKEYVTARQLLKGSNEAHKAGKTAADNFNKTMDPEYQTKLKQVNAELELCEKLVGRSQSQMIAGYRKQIDANVFAFSNQPATLPNAKDGLISIFDRLVILKGDEEKKRGECITKRTEASGKIEKFQERYLIFNYDVLPKFRQADSEFAVDNYVEAKNLYEEVIEELVTIESENKPAYDGWMSNKDKLESPDGPRDLLEESLGSSSESVKELKYDALARETTDLLKNWQLSRDYKAANAIALRAIAAVLEIRPKLDRFNEQEKDRETLRGLTEKFVDSVTLSISKLEKKLGDVEPYKNFLDTYKAEWTKIRMTKTFENFVDFNASFEAFKTKVNDEIVNPIDAMLTAFDRNEIYLANTSVPDNALTATENEELKKLTDSIKAASNKKTAKEFEQKLSEISAKITLMKKDASAYESLVIAAKILETPYIENATKTLERIKTDLAGLAKDTVQNFDTLNTRVKDLEDDLTAVKQALDTERGTQRTAAIKEIEPCSELLKQLKDSNPKFETYFKEFTNRVEDLKAMADSKILTTVDQCCVAASALKVDLEGLLKGESFSEIDTDLKHIEEEFEKLKDTLPVRLAGLKMRFEKKIEPDLYKKGPVDGKSDVEAFLKEVKAAVEAADAAKKRKVEITALVKVCTDGLLTMTDAHNLKESFQGSITSASTPAEGDEESAQQRLVIIEMAIKRLKEMSAEDLLKEEQSKVREKNTEELRRIEFEAELKVFTDKLSKEATILMESTKPNENSNFYAEISELRDEADKMFKARNFDGALKKLDAARTAARRFLNNPFSIKVNTRNNLKKVGEDWLKTISTFVKSMNELKEEVEESMTTENARSVKNSEGEKFGAGSFTAMKEPLTEAARSFEATKFPDYIDKILKADDPANVREYRRLKEDALRFVRAYQTIVTEDPVLLSAASNPFGVVVSLSSVKDALGVLEINLRRA